MKKMILAAVLTLGTLATPAWASGPGEKYAHFEAKPSETLDQAVANFSEYNTKLQAILDGAVSDGDMADVHQLTYTLETALAKMNEEMGKLAETLEEVHQASEKLDREGVIKHGKAYLETSRKVVK
ncbi:DUF6746 family protein [Thauera mechernichensis]|uniref:DUF6746 family protein n=1 Tax=Thauera mechernichensis TaxID=82788 RepID=A0ABW3WA40_9RHOO|nr:MULTISPECIES: DUF6746 family protein [Thauera]MDG3063559.1 hypothetical protein [Thauera mechernichensis]HNR59910.1 hypothetical protein [Thauera sp.]HNS91781.1 hypothetical protein [Thauera sp.]HRJ23631.1 hypothetical protein [Thauera sp.]